jgi:anti-sigma factor RsiW
MNRDDSNRHAAPDARRENAADDDVGDPVSAQGLNAYIDGELPLPKRRLIELRMVAEPAVRSRVTELVQVRALVRLAYGATRTR